MLFARGSEQHFLSLPFLGDKSLPLIERLCANFSTVIDPHESYRLRSGGHIKRYAMTSGSLIGFRPPTISMRFREHCPQSSIQFADQSVNDVHMAIIKTKRAPKGARLCIVEAVI